MSNDVVEASGITDTERLDWMFLHPGAQLDVDPQTPDLKCFIVTWLLGDEALAEGVSGRFLSRGATHRDCIDAFLRGEAKRVG